MSSSGLHLRLLDIDLGERSVFFTGNIKSTGSHGLPVVSSAATPLERAV